jgi:hypothetical protein
VVGFMIHAKLLKLRTRICRVRAVVDVTDSASTSSCVILVHSHVGSILKSYLFYLILG